MENNYQFHKPVLLGEVLDGLAIKDSEVYVDCTFGAGGYSSAILGKANCKLYAFDRDSTVLKFAGPLNLKFGDRFCFINDNFSAIKTRLNALGIELVDGIVLDLGVSSMQLDEEDRGFSFNSNARLDMRMDRTKGVSAFEVVNYKSEKDLAVIIRDFGEESKSRQIARKIVQERQKKEIETAIELASIVRSVFGGFRPGKIDQATKTFQAIRIFVNDELGELRRVLDESLSLLKSGGRLVVVSFHSLEDSYVKHFFRKNSGYDDRNISRYDPKILLNQNKKYPLVINQNKAIKPSDKEIESNVRSRSARLRVAIKN